MLLQIYRCSPRSKGKDSLLDVLRRGSSSTEMLNEKFLKVPKFLKGTEFSEGSGSALN